MLKETKLTVIALDIVYKAVLWPQEDARGPNNIFYCDTKMWKNS